MNFGKNAIKRIALLTTAFLTAATVGYAVSPTGTYAASRRKGVVVADALNVRNGPGLQYYIRNVISEGEPIVILETKDGWHKIQLGNNAYGWVSGDYISINGKVGTTLAFTTTTAKTKSTTAKKTTKTTKTTTTKKTTKTTKTTTTKKTTKTTKTTKTQKTTKTTTKANRKSVDLGYGIIRVTGVYTNLRQGKGAGYGIIKRIYRNTEAGIIEKNGSWYKVKLADTTVGWVSRKYVAVSGYKEASPSKSSSEPSKIIIAVSSVNVRSAATTNSKLIGTVRMNEVYTYAEIKNGWYKIVTPSGESGYVKGDFVDNFRNYAVNGGGKYIWPTQTATRISTYFGNTEGRVHYGIDIAAPGGSQIVAVSGGTVVTNTYDAGGYGYLIVIEQSDGIRAYYGHMRKASFLKVGTKVKAGDTIGIVGTTGKSTGNHLHLEFRKGNQRVDPIKFYPAFAKK